VISLELGFLSPFGDMIGIKTPVLIQNHKTSLRARRAGILPSTPIVVASVAREDTSKRPGGSLRPDFNNPAASLDDNASTAIESYDTGAFIDRFQRPSANITHWNLLLKSSFYFELNTQSRSRKPVGRIQY